MHPSPRFPLLAFAALLLILMLPAPASGAFGYLGEWGGLTDPQGVATDAAGNVYVAECPPTFTVRSGQPILYVEARGRDADGFELISPTGTRDRPAVKRSDMFTQTIEDVTGMAVYGPRASKWRLRSRTAASTRFAIQTIPKLGRVVTRSIRPSSSKARRRPVCASSVRLSWRRAGMLPSDTRLRLYASTSSKGPGKLLRSDLPTTGRATVKMSSLADGANYLYLAPRSKGITFAVARFPVPVWRKAPSLGQMCTSAIKPSSSRTRRLSRRVTSIRLAWRRAGGHPLAAVPGDIGLR